MMKMEYPRRFPRTRRQLLLQCAVSTLILLPPLVWRFAHERLVISMALGGLALVGSALPYRGLRFLAEQEQRHSQPTPEMTFVFMVMSIHPLAMNTFLLILLAEM